MMKCPNWKRSPTAAILLTSGLLVMFLLSCRRPSASEVVVYAALDREFSEPILRDFEKQTGIRVRTKFDTESTKSVGLTSQIIAESRGRMRCDVFWNNEILNTLRLDELHLLAAAQPRHLDDFPASFRSRDNRWFGFAARARVLIVNTELVGAEQMPDSIYSLVDPRWRGQIGMAKPLFGTTATHAVCLFEALGHDVARDFFRSLQRNEVKIVAGNKQVAEDVAHGRLAFGLTDTDDAMIELESGFPVRLVYPDSQPSQIGTLFIPNTLAIMRHGPHPQSAEALLDFLLDGQIEYRLAEGSSAQIPLSKAGIENSKDTLRVESPSSVHAMHVDFAQAASQWQLVGEFLKSEFLADQPP